TNAKFVLVIEKEATFQHLLSSGILKQFGPCIIITGKGYPDVATRQLVKVLGDHQRNKDNLRGSMASSRSESWMPILGFFDNDPYGGSFFSIFYSLSPSSHHFLMFITRTLLTIAGIEILSIYKFGSQAMSFDNENLATTNIKWIGLH
ncbi:1251_t:CDS:2, partial [Acaulospora morrowiae]